MGGAFESKPGGSTLVESSGLGRSPAALGKQTLTGQLSSSLGTSSPVQRKAEHGEPLDAKESQAHASRGVAEAAAPLPHATLIQRAFGRHDIGTAKAQIGGAAADASTAIGAKAYAQGDRVGFAAAPDLHTAAHEAAHVIQQRAGHAPAGGLDAPGDHLERHADEVADAVVAGESAEPLLDSMIGRKGGAVSAVQRKTDAAPDVAKQRRMLELYLAANQTHVWRVIGDRARAVSFPDPHARLTWTHEKMFVRELLMQLEANIRDFVPLAKLDEILYPSDAMRTLGAMLPATDAWSPPLGLAIAQALQIAIVSSLHRLGPRYLAVADARGAAGDGAISPSALTYSMPLDRYVGAAMCAPHVLAIEPADAKTRAAAKAKPTELRPTTLAWEGARDPRLWNWVRATEPNDATAEEVAATLWTVTDRHGEPNAAFNAYLLAAAPPLFGIPKKFAIKNPNARQYAPSHALVGDDSVASELVGLANSAAGDSAALHQSPAVPAKNKAHAEPPAELDAVLSLLDDCGLQLDFVSSEVTSWNLAGHVAPGRAFVARKAHELATADTKVLVEWNRVISGQRERLFRISGAIHSLASTAKKLGVKNPMAPEAMPVREILELLATAAGTAHLAQTSDAKLQQALELQAGLNARAIQATERDLAGAHLDFSATMGAKSRNGYATEVGELQDRSRRIQTTMINGGEVDAAEVDEVTLRSGEIALRERVLGTIHSTLELQSAAMAAKAGLAAHIAMLFSGKFRSLEAVCEHIRGGVVPLQTELMMTEQRIQTEAQDQVGTPAQKAKHRATRRAVLAKAQAAFAKLAADSDLQHFFQEGAKVVQNQQFRTACVQAAAMIGIAVLAAATGGAAAELAGSMLMEAGGVATVAELSTVARVGISTANIVADTAVNAVGQTVIQGGSLKEAFAENLFMAFASTALFGTIARASAEAARLEGREALTWARANTFAQKAFVAGREAGAITVHTVWGAAIGYVAHRAVGGRQPSPMEARDWMLQGASVAIGRGVHKSIGARMPGLERLAKRNAEARRLVLDAQQLRQLASNVEHGKDPATAVELLDQRTKLLREEIEAIEHIVAKDGDASGELGKMRKDLEHQVHESTSQAMLETKFHLLGLEELVPGTLWKGSNEQIQHALKEARANSGKVASQDPTTKRWKLALDGREVEIQEVASAATPRLLDTQQQQAQLLLDEIERSAGGLRRPALNTLEPAEIARLQDEFAALGGDPSILAFNKGAQTSYVDALDRINVRGDVNPVDGAHHPRSAMSSKAVLGHELGHRAHRGTKLPPGAWNDEFRASYWAAKNLPGLSDVERVHLVLDAMERAREAGVPIKPNPLMRKILYGY